MKMGLAPTMVSGRHATLVCRVECGVVAVCVFAVSPFTSMPLTIPQNGFISSLVSDYSKEAVAMLAAHEASGTRVPELLTLLPWFLYLGLRPDLALPAVCRLDLPQKAFTNAHWKYSSLLCSLCCLLT